MVNKQGLAVKNGLKSTSLKKSQFFADCLMDGQVCWMLRIESELDSYSFQWCTTSLRGVWQMASKMQMRPSLVWSNHWFDSEEPSRKDDDDNDDYTTTTTTLCMFFSNFTLTSHTITTSAPFWLVKELFICGILSEKFLVKVGLFLVSKEPSLEILWWSLVQKLCYNSIVKSSEMSGF